MLSHCGSLCNKVRININTKSLVSCMLSYEVILVGNNVNVVLIM